MGYTLLFPRLHHRAMEERYASWQSELLVKRDLDQVSTRYYDSHDRTRELLRADDSHYVIVVTDPLIVPPPGLIPSLSAALDQHPESQAALPVTNDSSNPRQRRAPIEPYLTLRQFQQVASTMAAEPALRLAVEWDESDPGVYLARRELLAQTDAPLSRALQGQPVQIVTNSYTHRYASHRGQVRMDLLERISPQARSVLEFGCGEAALGAALKERQGCRVVGIELDRDAARVAATRLDAVHSGDVRSLVAKIDERFEWIVGGDILEHLDEPWTFLMELKKLSEPGGHLLLSVPNIASWPIVVDLLRGRFDYVYMGITCAGHLRFFTRQSISEMLEISGWSVESILPQEHFVTPEYLTFQSSLEKAGIDHSKPDLLTPGYYVLAKNGQ